MNDSPNLPTYSSSKPVYIFFYILNFGTSLTTIEQRNLLYTGLELLERK